MDLFTLCLLFFSDGDLDLPLGVSYLSKLRAELVINVEGVDPVSPGIQFIQKILHVPEMISFGDDLSSYSLRALLLFSRKAAVVGVLKGGCLF